MERVRKVLTPHEKRQKAIWQLILSGQLSQEEAVHRIAALWTQEVEAAEEEGYDKAATDITQKLQNCIPKNSRTVEEARLKGAWTDAAAMALNHLGNYPNREKP